MTSSRSVVLLLLAVLLGGCERGCLPRAVADRNGGAGADPLDLRGTDCPAGMARCTGGVVEASRAFHVPDLCPRGEACTCPWVRVDACKRGCVKEGLSLPLDAARARVQLCRPDVGGSAPVEIVAPAAEAPPACEPGWICAAGHVWRCGASSTPVARCTLGCATDPRALDEEVTDEDTATFLLCAR